MSGGKGGTQTTEVRLPEAIERASAENLSLANEVGRIGYVPYQGPTVAGLSSGQQASMANTNAAANAFGLAQSSIPASPQAMTSAGDAPAPTTPAQSPPAPQYDSAGSSPGSKGAQSANTNDDPALANYMAANGKGGQQPQQPDVQQPHQMPMPSQQLSGEMGGGYSPYGLFAQGVNSIPSGQLGAVQGYAINPQSGGLPARPLPEVNISPRSRGKK